MAVAAGGCGRSGGASETDQVTACDILTAADLEAVLGGPVERPAASAPGSTDALAGRSGCAWSTEDGEKAALVELVRTADMSDRVRRTGFSAEARFAAAAGRHPDAVTPGATSFYVEEAATIHVLFETDAYVTIEVATTPPSAAEPTARALAARAVAGLGRLSAE